MALKRKVLVTRDVWRTAWTTFKSTRRQLLALLVVGLILPQALLSLIFDVHSVGVARELKASFTLKQGATESFAALLLPAGPYLTGLAAFILLIGLVLFGTYFALVHTAVDHLRGAPCRGALRAWGAGLKAALPGGAVLFLAFVALATIGQVLIAPAIMLAALALVMPVVMVAERRGALRALATSLLLRYVRGSEYSGWAVFFFLLTLGAVVYTFLAGVGMAAEAALFLDERLDLPRHLWTMTFPGMDFGPVYLAVDLFETTVTMTLAAAVPLLTAALYFTVAARREIAQA
jgi:hypothetical protein